MRRAKDRLADHIVDDPGKHQPVIVGEVEEKEEKLIWDGENGGLQV